MSDIFISYKREDLEKARQLAGALEKEGFSVWWDSRLRAGEHFDDLIEQALQEAGCVIVLWSHLSVQSRYVKDESSYALRRHKLVPIAIEDVEVPFRFEGIQTLRLVDWDGTAQFFQFRKLVGDISVILDQPTLETDELQPAPPEPREEKQPTVPAVPRKLENIKQATESGSRRWFGAAAIGGAAVLIVTVMLFMLQRNNSPPNNITVNAPKEKAAVPFPKPPKHKEQAIVEKDKVAEKNQPKQLPEPNLWPTQLSPDCESCPELVIIPPGVFNRGYYKSGLGTKLPPDPNHTIRIDSPLAVGRYEVTRSEFKQFVDETTYDFKGCTTYDGEWIDVADRDWHNPGFEQHDNHPVTCVSWNDARAYSKWLSKKTGHRYRLLSSSEWEYAARAGSATLRYWGTDLSSACKFANVADISAEQNYSGWEIHNCTDSHVYTAPVGSFLANDFGLHDMLGNVFEWVADCWTDNIQSETLDDKEQTKGKDCSYRTLRGGSWFSRPDYVQVSFHNRFAPDTRSSTFGFRVVRDLKL